MSASHLAPGSRQPPKVDGLLRLYSNEFCPYAERVRLVLKAKNIPHDIVNINLTNKPEWYSKVNPEGKLPALDTGSKVVVESLDIVDFLDAEYPSPALYDAKTKQKDKDLIEKIGPLTAVFGQVMFAAEKKSPEEWAKELAPHYEIFEKELASRGTPYFGGDKPGMVDYMLWPWSERVPVITKRLGQRLPFADDQFALLRQWGKSMRQQPVCDEIYLEPERLWKILQARLNNVAPDYDNA